MERPKSSSRALMLVLSRYPLDRPSKSLTSEALRASKHTHSTCWCDLSIFCVSPLVHALDLPWVKHLNAELLPKGHCSPEVGQSSTGSTPKVPEAQWQDCER